MKNKPILIVTNLKTDSSGNKYVGGVAYLTNGVSLHHIKSHYAFTRAYICDLEKEFKIKIK